MNGMHVVWQNEDLYSDYKKTDEYDKSMVRNDSKMVRFNVEASFKGQKALTFMKRQGYERKPKVSYEAIRHDFAVNQILPGGSVKVENLTGERIITSRTYVKKDYSQNRKITLFTDEQNLGSSYTLYTKTQYSYSNTARRDNIFKWIGKSIKFYQGDASGGAVDINTVYDWENVLNLELLKLRGK